MTALYLERYLNFGLTPRGAAVGQADHRHRPDRLATSSPCNRHHLVLAERVREGIREAGGIAIEFPVHPIQETGKRPTAGLDRNLAYLGLVEVLYGYPLDGVVLTIGCDKTTPACLMAAATVNIPAIALSVGPMLNGWYKGERTGSGTIVWKAREMLAAGEIDYERLHRARRLLGALDRLLQHHGHGHDHELAGRGAGHAAARLGRDPGALSRPRRRWPTRTGKRIVEMVREDLKPSDILTRDAFHQRHRRQLGDRRLDQRADPPRRHRAPHRRRADDRRLADATATRCRCWSTCSRPASISARTITTPAACRRWSAS